MIYYYCISSEWKPISTGKSTIMTSTSDRQQTSISKAAQQLCNEIVEPKGRKSNTVIYQDYYKDSSSGFNSEHYTKSKNPTRSTIIEKTKVINNFIPKTNTASKTLINKFKAKENLFRKTHRDIALNTMFTGPLRCDNNCVTNLRRRDKISCCKCKNSNKNESVQNIQTIDHKKYFCTDKACAQCIDAVSCGTQYLDSIKLGKQNINKFYNIKDTSYCHNQNRATDNHSLETLLYKKKYKNDSFDSLFKSKSNKCCKTDSYSSMFEGSDARPSKETKRDCDHKIYGQRIINDSYHGLHRALVNTQQDEIVHNNKRMRNDACLTQYRTPTNKQCNKPYHNSQSMRNESYHSLHRIPVNAPQHETLNNSQYKTQINCQKHKKDITDSMQNTVIYTTRKNMEIFNNIHESPVCGQTYTLDKFDNRCESHKYNKCVGAKRWALSQYPARGPDF